jgi:hypothetical protein
VVAQTIKKVFQSPKYLVTSLVIFFILSFAAILYPNLKLVREIWASAGSQDAFLLAKGLLFSASTSFGVLSLIFIFLISFLFAVNLSLLIYYISLQTKRASKTELGKSTFGLVLGIIGVGCASCGSLLLLSFLSLVGAGGILSILPLHGQEFGLIGIAILLYSNYSVIKKINAPLVC